MAVSGVFRHPSPSLPDPLHWTHPNFVDTRARSNSIDDASFLFAVYKNSLTGEWPLAIPPAPPY